MSPDSSVAHYRITSMHGEGGMGAVYRATGAKLNRDRNRTLSRTTPAASLNHPNIAAICGSNSALIMELVGERALGGQRIALPHGVAKCASQNNRCSRSLRSRLGKAF